MNVYQKVAFGIVLIFAVAVLAQNWLTVILASAIVVALLTLPVTWNIIFWVIGMIGGLIGAVGRSTSWFGDSLTGWSKRRRVAISHSKFFARPVPNWGDKDLRVPEHSAATGDAGLDILKPEAPQPA